MRKLLKYSVLLILFFPGCAGTHLATPKPEIPDSLWEDLSRDLAQVYGLVESINKNLERERSQVKVQAEPWRYPKGKKIAIMTASRKVDYPIIKVTDIKIPTKKGDISAKIAKTLGAKGVAWFAVEKTEAKIPLAVMAWVDLRESEISVMGKYMPLYASGGLRIKTGALPAIKQFVSYYEWLDKAFEEVSKALEVVQKKYKESPIYIDGFTVHIGILFSVDISFKIRS